MTKGYVPSSKPSDVQQDSKEQFKTTGTSFSQNWIHLSLNSNASRLVCQTVIVIVIWLICYGKQNNGNLKYVLKQDSSYSLYGWITITYHQACVLETFFCVSDHIMGFSLPYFRYELLSLK